MSALVAVLVGVAVLLWPARRPGGGAAGDGSGPSAVAVPREAPSREDLTVRAVAECADLLGVALIGGVGLLEGLDVVADVVGGPAAEHLRVVSAAVRWGVPLQEAWRLVPESWSTVGTAFVVADRAGVAPSRLLAEAGVALRHTQARAASVQAGELSARIALPLGLTLLPGFVLTTVLPLMLGLARSLVSG